MKQMASLVLCLVLCAPVSILWGQNAPEQRPLLVDFISRPPTSAGTALKTVTFDGKPAWQVTGPCSLSYTQPELGNWTGCTALLVQIENPLEDFVRGSLAVQDTRSRNWATMYSRPFLLKPGSNSVRVKLVGLTAADQKTVLTMGELKQVDLRLETPKDGSVTVTAFRAYREKVENMVLVDFDAGEMPNDCGRDNKVMLVPGHTTYPDGFSMKLTITGPNGWAGIYGETRANWDAWDRVAFDVENTNDKPVTGTWVMKNKASGNAPALRSDQTVVLQPGMHSYYVPIRNVKDNTSNAIIDLGAVFQWNISWVSQQDVATKPLYISNWRLEKGAQGSGSVALMEGRVSRTKLSPELTALRDKAVAARDRLAKLVDEAAAKGIDTHYYQVYLTCAELGLDVRWYLPLQEKNRPEYCRYIADSCSRAADDLSAVLAGGKKTLAVPPVPDYRQVRREGGALIYQNKPVLLFTLGSDPTYFAPGDFTGASTAVGASRYNVEETPIYPLYQKDPGTHRVGYTGWCGHIIRDIWSMGGGKDPVVLCLESPAMREAIKQSILNQLDTTLTSMKTPAGDRADLNKKIAVSMGYEYFYICYCDESRRMFIDWLKQKYGGDVAKVNDLWGTKYASLDDVRLLAHDDLSTNRAYMFDWMAFNFQRVTDYMKWAKGVIQSKFPQAACCTSTSYSFYGNFGLSGFDIEQLNNEVCDVILQEAGTSTIKTDLFRSFTDQPKVTVDFEYHGDIEHLMGQFLHGTSAMDMWWWPEVPPVSEAAIAGSGFSGYQTSVGHSYRIPLSDVALCLRTALDLRRLGDVIQPFQFPKHEVAILYSRTTAMQVEQELLNARSLPSLAEMENIFEGARTCDVPVRFVTERQMVQKKVGDLKLLWVPSATHLPAEAAKAILDYAAAGGTVVVTPNSLQFDEYHRPAPYLADLGIEITKYRRPRIKVGELSRETEENNGFLQGLTAPTTSSNVPKEALTVLDAGILSGAKLQLKGAGITQTVRVTGNGKVVATFADGSPAMVEISRGTGRILYLAIPLETSSVTALVDYLVGKLGVTRMLTVTSPDGTRVPGVEVRSRTSDQGVVAYVWNLSGSDRTLTMAPGVAYSGITNLSAETPQPGLTITVPNKETVFLLFRK